MVASQAWPRLYRKTIIMIENLRELALARNATTFREYPICLDDNLRAQIDEQTKLLKDAKIDLDYLEDKGETKAKSLGNQSPITAAKRRISEISKKLTQLEADAKQTSIIVRLRRLSPIDYEKIQFDHLKGDDLDVKTFWPAMLEASYADTISPAGEDLHITYDELAANVLNSADYDNLIALALTMNRTAGTVSFTKPSFGPLGTN